jgi:hypothetical protein
MKTMSKAYKSIQTQRDLANAKRTKLLAKDLTSVVYLYRSNTGFCAIGYRGRSMKPAFNFRYPSYDARALAVSKWMINQSNAVEKRASKTRALFVGDVLKASWGYEQTNINYYKVTALVGKTMVEIVEVAKKMIETDMMEGCSIPDPDCVIGEPLRRKVSGESVSVDSSRYARKKHLKMVAGCPVFTPDQYSSYH